MVYSYVSERLLRIHNTYDSNAARSPSLIILTLSTIPGQGMTNTPCPGSISLAEPRTKQYVVRYSQFPKIPKFYDSFLSWAVVQNPNS